MVRIAVCDDCPADLHTLRTLLDALLVGHDTVADVRLFSHPDELLGVMEHSRFDVYLLDIVMPMVNGIEVGRTIRRSDREAQIVYVTSEPGFALEAFDTSPINFILKPIDTQKFFSTLSYVLSKAEREQHDMMVVKVAEGLRTLSVSAISCCEYASHRLRYSLCSGEQVVTRYKSESFSTCMAPLLARLMFIKSHESFVVNVAMITHLRRTSVTLRGGVTVPVSRSRYPDVRDAYLAFLLKDHGDA